MKKDRGFTQLMYKGVPVIQNEPIPRQELWLISKDGKTMTKFNIKTLEKEVIKIPKGFKKNYINWYGETFE